MAAAASALVALLGARAAADGFHVVDFEHVPIRWAWARYKSINKLPELKPGQTYSDLVTLDPENATGEVTHEARLTGGAPVRDVMVAATMKMIQILKYCGEAYFTNESPDPPLWYYTSYGRKETLKQAQAILGEIGWQAAPYLFEALETDIRFTTGPDRDEIFKLQAALQEVEFAGEALDDALRKKTGHFRDAESDLATMTRRFLDERDPDKKDSMLRAAEFKERADRLAQLIEDFAKIDENVRKLRDKRVDAVRKAQECAKKVNPRYARTYCLDVRVSDNYIQLLKDAIAACGPKALPFLDRKARHNNPSVARAAKDLAYIVRSRQPAAVRPLPGEEAANLHPPAVGEGRPDPVEAPPPPPNPWVEKNLADLDALKDANEKVARQRERHARAMKKSNEIEARLKELQKTGADDPAAREHEHELRRELARSLQEELECKFGVDKAEADLEALRRKLMEESARR
ncbi:MAG: hypothetical protein KIS92_03965 [Planctomycetota bacterium]|nr:hypothetical protein [Planctomycetota bacterium]